MKNNPKHKAKSNTIKYVSLLLTVGILFLGSCNPEPVEDPGPPVKLMVVGKSIGDVSLNNISNPQLSYVDSLQSQYHFDLDNDSINDLIITYWHRLESGLSEKYIHIDVKETLNMMETIGSIHSSNATGDSVLWATLSSNLPEFSDTIALGSVGIYYPKPYNAGDEINLLEGQWASHHNSTMGMGGCYIFNHFERLDTTNIVYYYANQYFPAWKGLEHKYLVFKWLSPSGSSFVEKYGWVKLSLLPDETLVVHEVFYE